ncbi:PKD domain containing protein [Desulfurispirillum indicum S5]|uniref:PKD domain containing protein n=1 Tax=Desulfurispirillum indicum (strain ATCC BAA-1389 / DSM 22839 / S5) TaxID=653733 RepID=E6W1A1_DESIS|nr:PKD domain-containing protein [Desulfurispirillum indicum]ADU66521.1 PKD domain containing protein [Desulfurispirillum indicum S5]
MNHSASAGLIVLTTLCLLLLSACGSSSSSTPEDPVAVLSSDRTSLPMGESVLFDASGSTPGVGNSLSYSWTLLSQPVGSTVTLVCEESELHSAQESQDGEGEEEQQPAESADCMNDAIRKLYTDLPGAYEVNVQVADSRASTHARQTINATNTEPVAVITPVPSTAYLGWVQLDGSHSAAPTDGDAAELTYAWSLTVPAASDTSLDNFTAVNPRFLADAEGTYTVSLVVRHGDTYSAPAHVEIDISAVNAIPVADVGGTQEGSDRVYRVNRGETVTLDGTGSTDADGDDLAYSWRFVGEYETFPIVPTGSQVMELTDARSATPSFIPDMAGTWYVELHVHDGLSRSQPATAKVIVTKPEDAPNTRPVLVANTKPTYVEANVIHRLVDWFDAYDIDGDTLTFTYTWLEKPSGNTDPLNWNPQGIIIAAPGTYTVSIVANDGHEDSEPLEITLQASVGGLANTRPVAEVVVPVSTALTGQVVLLDGTKSYDPDDDQIFWQWSWIERPVGSNTDFLDGTATMSRAEFIPDVPGAYIAALSVTDSQGAVSVPWQVSRQNHATSLKTATILAKEQNHAPVLNPGFTHSGGVRLHQLGRVRQQGLYSPVVLAEGKILPAVNMLAGGFDPDGDRLYYNWTLEEQPADSTAELSLWGRLESGTEPDSAAALENINQPGLYRIKVEASDGLEEALPQYLSFTVHSREDGNWPGVLMERIEADGEQIVLRLADDQWNDRSLPEGTIGSATSGTCARQSRENTPTLIEMNQAGGWTIDEHIRLTAGQGQAYTIADLQLVARNEELAAVIPSPSILGIQNGDTITEAGTAVRFWIPALPEGDQYASYVSTSYPNNYNFDLSFRIVETGQFIDSCLIRASAWRD